MVQLNVCKVTQKHYGTKLSQLPDELKMGLYIQKFAFTIFCSLNLEVGMVDKSGFQKFKS